MSAEKDLFELLEEQMTEPPARKTVGSLMLTLIGLLSTLFAIAIIWTGLVVIGFALYSYTRLLLLLLSR